MSPKQRIAVVGSGIAGLGAAWVLADPRNGSGLNDVTLYEAADRLGGHANTVVLDDRQTPISVDTGFIVYNEQTYPNLIGLLAELGVATEASDMSFSFSDPGRLEYAGRASGLLRNRAIVESPRFRRMIVDLLRFRKHGRTLLTEADGATIGQVLRANRYSDGFIRDYVVPMTAAVWSANGEQILDYPAESLLRFLDNHGLIRITGAPQWRTVSGGSREYVQRLHDRLTNCGAKVLTSAPVQSVTSRGDSVAVTAGDRSETFDHVVLATHSDQSLRMLGNEATPGERRVLGAIRYESNVAVLHRDPALMPTQRRLWSSWNSLADPVGHHDRTSLTYWMNRLQNIEGDDLFVTLNPKREPRGDLCQTFEYAHPQFDTAAIAAQHELAVIQGRRRIWFAGAWCGYGFHEDGLQSGLNVANALGSVADWTRHVTPMSSAPPVPRAETVTMR
ncbi:MAG: putative NAD/FAD-binding protein [Verrucomicrobiales bacterium]|jgi:predicted NAD/FAD-binding protein